jgi:hypothetical protein
MYHANTQTREFFNQKCKVKQGKKFYGKPSSHSNDGEIFCFVAVHIFFCYLAQVPVQLTF